ncbi:MAG: hypothetical protein WDZ35_06045 [Crocinitomicaceae bacterium]
MNKREKLCAWLFEVTKLPYAKLCKQKRAAWKLSSTDLLTFPVGSLGYETGKFLKTNGFELIDKLESHDVYHVITGMSTSVKDEVGMQFLLLGNGKRSLYLFSTVGICFFLLPEHLSYFIRCYKTGKRYHSIFKLNLLAELNTSVLVLRKQLLKHSNNRLKVFTHLSNHY